MHGELEYLVKAGLTPEQALAAATSVSADTFHLTGRGPIAPGLCADLVLVNGDATADITATRDIVEVWKQGIPVDRESWRQSIHSATSVGRSQ
jgi:imidazolonepropionase-like amidohydrolase